MDMDASDIIFTTRADMNADQKNSSSSSMQAWLRTQLEDYVKLNLLGPREEPDWQNGRALVCLVHHLFPDRVPDLPTLLLLRDEGDDNYTRDAIAILHEELGVPIPSSPYNNTSVMDYLEDVRERAGATGSTCTHRDGGDGGDNSIPILSTTTTTTTTTTSARQVPLISETVVQLSVTEHQSDAAFEQRTAFVMARITHLRGQLCDMISMVAPGDGGQPTTTQINPEEDLITRVEQFETNLEVFVTQDWAVYEAYIEDMTAAVAAVDEKDKNPAPVGTRLQEINAAHASLESDLQDGFRAIRTRAKFAQLTWPLRNELDFIEAKLINISATAALETDIIDLERRVQVVSGLVRCVEQDHGDTLRADRDHDDDSMLLHRQQEFERLKQQSTLMEMWVGQVRVWYDKTTSARQWIQERIDRIESQILQDDGLLPLNLAATAAAAAAASKAFPAASQLSATHQDLEREVAQFEKEDVEFLRRHVQTLTGPGKKEFSPADSAVMEIISDTCMLLDRLMLLLKRRSHDLSVITSHLSWEQEWNKADCWIVGATQQVSTFVKEALWEFEEEKRVGRAEADERKAGLANRLSDIEHQTLEFEQGQFTLTGNTYQDLDDLVMSELPDHLKDRQMAVETSFEALTAVVQYARRVVEQRCIVTDFVYEADDLLAKGNMLTVDMQKAELSAVARDSDRSFADRVRQFQDQAMQLVTRVMARIEYPEHPHQISDENQKTNTMVRGVIDASKRALTLLGDSLHVRLTAYQQVLKLQKVAFRLDRDMNQFERSVQKQQSDVTLSKVDVLTERIALEESDVQRLQTECDNRLAKIVSIKNGIEKTLLDVLEGLKRDVAAAETEVVPAAALGDRMTRAQNMLASLEASTAVHQREVDVLRKRLVWENHCHQVSRTVSSSTRDIWKWIEKIQWRPDTPALIQTSTMKQELEMLLNTSDELRHRCHEWVNAFAEMIKELDTMLDGAASVPAHFQRRQENLQRGLDELHESFVFAQTVLDQHMTIAAYMEKASSSQESGAQLLARIEEVIQKVMDNQTSTSFTNAIERYGREIADVWADCGQRIGYPRRTAGATASRLSTSDDDINMKIKISVSSQQEKLKYLYDKMQLCDTLYTASLQFKASILRYVMESNEATKRMSMLNKAIVSDQQNLMADKFDLSTLEDPSTLNERYSAYVSETDRGRTACTNLYSRCVELAGAIRRAGCGAYVQTTMADESVSTLKDQVDNVVNVSVRHGRELDVYGNRVDWERHLSSAMTTTTSVQDRIQTLREQLQEALCITECATSQKISAWEAELDNTRKVIDEIAARVSETVEPAFERMQTSYCDLPASTPPTVVSRQNNLLDLLAKLLDIAKEQQSTLNVLSERIRAAEYTEALAYAMQQTLGIQNAIDNMDTKDLADNCIEIWHGEVESLALYHMEPLRTSAVTQDERTGHDELVATHQRLVVSLENAETRLSDRHLVEAFESRAAELLLFFKSTNDGLQTTQNELDTIAGDPVVDHSVCESCRTKHIKIDRAIRTQMDEYSQVRSLFDTLQQKQISTDRHSIQNMDLEKMEQLAHQSLTSVDHAINFASQWKDLHVALDAIESEIRVIDDMAYEKAEETLLNITSRHANMHVVAEKLNTDSGQHTNESIFQKHHEQMEAIIAVAKEKVEIRKLTQALEKIEAKARGEACRINEQMDETATQFNTEIVDNGLVIQLEQHYNAYTANPTVRKSEIHGALTEQLGCYSRRLMDLGCDQQLFSKAQEALDTFQAAIDAKEDLAALLQRAISQSKDTQSLLVQMDSYKAEIQDTPLATWDIKSNLAEFEDKVLQLEHLMGTFMNATDILLKGDIGSGDAGAVGCLKKHVIAVCGRQVEEAWKGLRDSFAELKDKVSSREEVFDHMKEVLKLCSETHERVNNLESGSMQLSDSLSSRPLPDMLREQDALRLEQELGMIEAAFGDHVAAKVQKLDDQIGELEDDGVFMEQRIEMDAAIANLFRLMEDNRDRMLDALDTGRCLDMADDIELLLKVLQEAVINVDDTSKQPLRVAVELDTNKQKIVQSLKAAQSAADDIANDTNRERVLAHLSELDQRWQQTRGQLMMGEPPTGLEARTRKPSLSTRKSPPSRLPVVSAAPSVQSNTSSPLASMNRLLPSSSSSSQQMSRLQQRRRVTSSLRRTPSKSASNAETMTTTTTTTVAARPVNNYKADPRNDLDMEIGRIVNTIAYKVTVKRVPGETGRYCFGDSTPKIAFCRVLKSKMVMVRVGGGWMELTEFLRNHALFDGDYSAPKPPSPAEKSDLRFQECFIETRKNRIRERSITGSV